MTTQLHNALREELKPGTPVFFADDPSVPAVPATVVNAPVWNEGRITKGHYTVELDLQAHGRTHRLTTIISRVYVPAVG